MKNKINDFIEILKKLNYIFTLPQKKSCLKLLVVIIMGASFETIGVSAIVPFVQAMTDQNTLMKNQIIKSIVIAIGIADEKNIVLLVGILVIAVYVIKNLFLAFSAAAQIKFQCRIEKELSTYMLVAYMKRPYTYFLNINSSELLQNVERDSNSLYNMLGAGLKILTEGLAVMLIGVYIFIQDPIMAFGIMILTLLCCIGTVYGFKGVLKKNGIKNRNYAKIKYQNLYQVTNGIKEIKVMNRENFFTREYIDTAEKFQKTKRIQGTIATLPERIIEAVCVSGLIGIVCARTMNGGNTVQYIPQLASFAVAAFRILPSISRITVCFNDFTFNIPALNAIYTNVHEVEIYEREVDNYVRNHSTNSQLASFNDIIKLEDIEWKYPNNDEDILSGLNLEIQKGQSVALIGASGAGKTTVADIIMGLFQPIKGIVSMDGNDIFSMKGTWSKMIGYVPQSVFMIDDTIKKNIAFGIPDTQIDEQKVWDALEQARLKDFVMNLPRKLDTELGERGIRFSGGQRQRVAIARALYYNPDILVLDEATAALDNETEAALMDSIESLQGKKTLIIVAHRLSTIKNCDKVYEIADKRAHLKRYS